jgi:hypothetical protein
MKKITLALFSVATLLGLSGCCKKKEKASKPNTSMKKEDCCKKKSSCKTDKSESSKKNHKGKTCDEKKSAYHSYLKLEEADDVLL